MSDSLDTLRHKIRSAGDLASVVRTMKALSAASIVQYEHAMVSLRDYFHTVELGMRVCLSQRTPPPPGAGTGQASAAAVVFGTDQGLVGQFNDTLADFVVGKLSAKTPGVKIWAVGERVHGRLAESGLTLADPIAGPASLAGVTRLAGSILLEWDSYSTGKENAELYLFHQRLQAPSLCEPVMQRLLPLDSRWWGQFSDISWPSSNLPEVSGPLPQTLGTLIREYLFVTILKACVESLVAENATRLNAMQRAEKNIGQLEENLSREFYRLRQNAIDDELFDLIAGFDTVASSNKAHSQIT